MTTILITGPIGSGKSLACRYLESKGYPVYDSDSRTKALYDSVPGLKDTLEQELGIPFHQLYLIFTDPDKKKRLEDIVYPLVAADIAAWKTSLDAPVAIIESANALGKPLFESLYDKVLLITAPYSERVHRNPKTAGRNSLQSFDESSADWVVINDGTKQELFDKIDNIPL